MLRAAGVTGSAGELIECEAVNGLERFPKRRPPLPPSYQRIYAQHYRDNRMGRSRAAALVQRAESWMHRQVAADVVDHARTLEIGAGTLNHLPYEPPSPAYDIVEPLSDLYRDSPELGRIRHVYGDVADIAPGARYDRIISIATFEHICDLPALVACCATLLASGGQLRVAIPSEGTWLWTLGWRLTTGLEFRFRHHLDYGVLMRHEHVNTAKEIVGVLAHCFGEVRGRVFGLARRLSLYQFYECAGPRLDRCRALLPPMRPGRCPPDGRRPNP
jgi:hypothetical protein